MKFIKISMILMSLVGVSLMAACSKGKTELTVSAAASLSEALEEIQTNYRKQHPDVELLFNFGASGALQRQIEQGAEADLFLSAAEKQMVALIEGKWIEETDRTALLSNELVVVVPQDSGVEIKELNDLGLPEVRNVAVGITESVPAGAYAKEALSASGLWESLSPKLVQGKDVRQVLQYVETGNADAGIVYKTDALSSEKARIEYAVSPDSYSPIIYPIGIVKATKHREEAERFYAYLQSGEALEIFKKYGFSEPKS